MTPIQHIQLHESEFTKSEHIIKEYVLNNLAEISSYPILTIAEKMNVSKSALMRFCKKCGFTGYAEFKYEVSRYLQSIVDFSENDSNKTERILTIYTSTIHELPNSISTTQLKKLTQFINTSRKIKIFGVHETSLAASYFSYRLATLGIDSEVVSSNANMVEKAELTRKDDLNIFISLSAETTLIKDALNSSNCNLVLITQNNHHKFKNKVDLDFILPTFHTTKKNIFLDSQALLFIAIDLIINNIASHQHTK